MERLTSATIILNIVYVTKRNEQAQNKILQQESCTIVNSGRCGVVTQYASNRELSKRLIAGFPSNATLLNTQQNH